MQLSAHCRRMLYCLTPILLFFVQVSVAFAQAGVPEVKDEGKSYAMGYLGVIVLLAVALILVSKSSGREKEPKFVKPDE